MYIPTPVRALGVSPETKATWTPTTVTAAMARKPSKAGKRGGRLGAGASTPDPITGGCSRGVSMDSTSAVMARPRTGGPSGGPAPTSTGVAPR